jgi:hypothetical protein
MEKDTKDTINKSLLLNWLNSANQDLALEDLGKWLEAKTNGDYVLIKNSRENIMKLLDNISNDSNQ